MSPPQFSPRETLRAFRCNLLESQPRVATAVVLEDMTILQVFPYTREAPSYRNKKGAVLREHFDNVEAWVRHLLAQHGVVELEVTPYGPITNEEPVREEWSLILKKPSLNAAAVMEVAVGMATDFLREECFHESPKILFFAEKEIVTFGSAVKEKLFIDLNEKVWNSLTDWLMNAEKSSLKKITSIYIAKQDGVVWGYDLTTGFCDMTH